jgi:hypothetical protein
LLSSILSSLHSRLYCVEFKIFGNRTVCGPSAGDNYAEDFSFAGPSLFSRELEGKRSRSRWVHRRIVCADEITAEALRDEELFKTMSAHGGVEMRGMRYRMRIRRTGGDQR